MRFVYIVGLEERILKILLVPAVASLLVPAVASLPAGTTRSSVPTCPKCVGAPKSAQSDVQYKEKEH